MKTNAQLQYDVMEALKWEPLLSASDIVVAARDGVITLTGAADSYSKKLAAERATKRVQGVRAVAEDIVVRPWGHRMKSDADIAAAAVNALQWCDSVPDEQIKVSVEQGWVKLEGEVTWQHQKDEAKREIENLSGVKGITNLITMKPVVQATDIKEKIQNAFKRSATIDSTRVGVDVNGSIVRLHGRVRSWAEREDAEHAAWAAPGVTLVKDELKIGEFEMSI